VIVTGNPRVGEGYPYPYPRKTVPLPVGTGTRGYGDGGIGGTRVFTKIRVAGYLLLAKVAGVEGKQGLARVDGFRGTGTGMGTHRSGNTCKLTRLVLPL
jgi:hypothetical protein